MSQTNEVEPEAGGNRPRGHEQFTVADMANHNTKFFDNRPDADDAMQKAKEAPEVEPELFPPGESPEWMYHGDDAEPDGGDVEIVDADHEPEAIPPEEVDRLPDDRHVGQDPLKWMPGEFVDEIDGSMAINRKGFEVLSHFYDVDVSADLEVAPEETGHEYARVKATATMGDRKVEAFGSAHVDRGDDHYLLLEMSDTRARKRALSIITGAGAVAVDELQNEPEGR